MKIKESQLRNIIREAISEVSKADLDREWDKEAIKDIYNNAKQHEYTTDEDDDLFITDWEPFYTDDEPYGMIEFKGNDDEYHTVGAEDTMMDYDDNFDLVDNEDDLEIDNVKLDDIDNETLANHAKDLKKDFKQQTTDFMYDRFGNKNVNENKSRAKVNESQLRNIIRESIQSLLREGNYNIDAAYHGPYGNRSQYAPLGDAMYSQPGELSILAQTPFKAKGPEGKAGRWARSNQFKSAVPKALEEYGYVIPKDMDITTPQENAKNLDKFDQDSCLSKQYADILKQLYGKNLQDCCYYWTLYVGNDIEIISKRCFKDENRAERDATNAMQNMLKTIPNLSEKDFESSGVEAAWIEKGCVMTDRMLEYYNGMWMD